MTTQGTTMSLATALLRENGCLCLIPNCLRSRESIGVFVFGSGKNTPYCMAKRNAKNLREYRRVCAEIFEERGQRCENCHRYIREPKWHNFHHTKGRITKEQLLKKEDLMLTCYVCHSAEHGQKVTNAEWLDM